MNTNWRKSSYSNGGNGSCVEVAGISGQIGVRDSKDPNGGNLAFGQTDWNLFVGAVRS